MPADKNETSKLSSPSHILEEAAEAISKVARTVQELQAVTVDKLVKAGVPSPVAGQRLALSTSFNPRL